MRALVVALVLLVMVPGVQAADQPKDLAAVHMRKATAAYNLGKFAEAAKEYEAAHEQTLDPNLLFNIGQAYRLVCRARQSQPDSRMLGRQSLRPAR